MSQFDYDIKYIPDISNSAADALFWYPYIQVKISALNTIAFDPVILDKVHLSYKSNSFFNSIIANPANYVSIYEFDNSLIFFKNHLCISGERTTYKYLPSLHYDDQNHFGYEKTYQIITWDYFWPELDKDVKFNSCSLRTSSLYANSWRMFHRSHHKFYRPYSQMQRIWYYPLYHW